MLIAIVLDRPLAEAKALVDDPAAFTREMTKILLAKQSHPLIAQMMRPSGSGDPPPAKSTASFFFRPTPYGFRQVVQHVSKHVAFGIN